jgi:hypothetical protein
MYSDPATAETSFLRALILAKPANNSAQPATLKDGGPTIFQSFLRKTQAIHFNLF